MNENGLRDAVSTYLKTLAPHVHFEKRWGGGLFQRKGVADYTGIAWGVPFAIELKHPDKPAKPEPDQQKYLDSVEAAGGMVLVANSLLAVKTFIAIIQNTTRGAL